MAHLHCLRVPTFLVGLPISGIIGHMSWTHTSDIHGLIAVFYSSFGCHHYSTLILKPIRYGGDSLRGPPGWVFKATLFFSVIFAFFPVFPFQLSILTCLFFKIDSCFLHQNVGIYMPLKICYIWEEARVAHGDYLRVPPYFALSVNFAV